MKLTHTDLKPENILLKNDTAVKVTDSKLFPIVSVFFVTNLECSYEA
jgi:serine/threonine protein kinase